VDEAAAWAEAERMFREDGAGYHSIAGATGLPKSTVRRRALERGWTRDTEEAQARGQDAGTPLEERSEAVRAAAAGQRQSLAARRAALAERLLDKAGGLVDEMDAEVVLRREAKVVPGGQGLGSTVEVVDVEQPGHDPSAKRNLATAAAILIDKSQLLAGEATSRHEMTAEETRERVKQIRDEVGERRARHAVSG
jgi:hypothetical protein